MERNDYRYAIGFKFEKSDEKKDVRVSYEIKEDGQKIIESMGTGKVGIGPDFRLDHLPLEQKASMVQVSDDRLSGVISHDARGHLIGIGHLENLPTEDLEKMIRYAEGAFRRIKEEFRIDAKVREYVRIKTSGAPFQNIVDEWYKKVQEMSK